MLRRFRWVETEVWKAAKSSLAYEQLDITPYGFAFINELSISRIYRLRASTQKAFRETLAGLLSLQAARKDAGPANLAAGPACAAEHTELPSESAESSSQPAENGTTSPEIGFVPSNSKMPATPAVSLPANGGADRQARRATPWSARIQTPPRSSAQPALTSPTRVSYSSS